MQGQPRLIWHPQAIFLSYVIRKILLTVVLKPLETWKFHFPCIYSSSLTTCWFLYSFLLWVENPSQCNSLSFHFGISQNWKFLCCVCASVKVCKGVSVNSGIIANVLAAFLGKLSFLFSMFLRHWIFLLLKQVTSVVQSNIPQKQLYKGE